MVWRCASHDPAHWSSTTGSAAMARAIAAATAIFVARNIARFYPTWACHQASGPYPPYQLLELRAASRAGWAYLQLFEHFAHPLLEVGRKRETWQMLMLLLRQHN